MKRILLAAITAGAFALTMMPAWSHDAGNTKVTPLLSKDFANITGKEGALFLVEYPPGASDPVHRHNAQVFVYVLEGDVIMQVKGGKEMRLKAGDTFYENPDDVHLVGKNASDSKPAKFLAFFVKDKGAPVLTLEK